MAKQLLIIAGPDEGRILPLPDADTLLIGRSRALEARLIDPYVSRVHCQAQTDEGRVILTDYDSAGGTYVNGKRITQLQLTPGDVIRIGETELRFQDADLAEQETWPPAGGAPGKGIPGAADQVSELVGQKLSQYEVGPVLAKGRTGLVFHGSDTRDDQPVALKVLFPEFTDTDDQRQRFIRAMKAALPLAHPNLVRVYAAGKTGPYCWAAMEYVQGESLTQVVQRHGTVGMLNWRNALRVGVHIARALDYAHRQGIIHRNVTPMNILVEAGTRTAKLGDLMLAKALEGTLAQQITKPGELVGNVLYLSPERTQQAAAVDGRSDFYSLGAVLYALLTGRPPFEEPTLAETVDRIRTAEPVPPKKYQLAIPDLLEGTVLKMLAKRPEDRFQQPWEMLGELERVAKFQGLAV
jgi:serine/threonine protein kinase